MAIPIVAERRRRFLPLSEGRGHRAACMVLFEDYLKEHPIHSPVRTQYLQIKRQHPDALLFFRMGDFYEMFDEDAEIVARELEIALTRHDFDR